MSAFDHMQWLNEPDWGLAGGVLWVQTGPSTDFWQRTHCGFRRDNGHAFLAPVSGEFRLRARFHFVPNAQYDQCGLFVRADENCWFKCSIELEPGYESRLGSVVTNHGYSDWATQDVSSSMHMMHYEVHGKDNDLVAACSFDGANYRQMRVAHLDTDLPLMAGIYGCSPTGQGFRFEVWDFSLTGGA